MSEELRALREIAIGVRDGVLAPVLDEIEAHVRRFIGFKSAHDSAAIALFVAHCYAVDSAPVGAYLRILKVLLRVTEKDGYWWCECAGCQSGWQVPYYAESVGDWRWGR
jgi:hypothetical protein